MNEVCDQKNDCTLRCIREQLSLITSRLQVKRMEDFLTCWIFFSPLSFLFSGRAYSKTLQQASISVLSKRQCEQRYSHQFTNRMLCAGSSHDDRRVDSCRGDSGGPLVCERPSGSWVVYGVTSWGHACRLQDSPGVYTKVSAFVPWIKKVIGQ